MSEKMSVSPTPIQRNALDVATELTKMYFDRVGFDSKEEIAEAFLTFYSTAHAAKNTHYSRLTEYMPDSLTKIVEK